MTGWYESFKSGKAFNYLVGIYKILNFENKTNLIFSAAQWLCKIHAPVLSDKYYIIKMELILFEKKLYKLFYRLGILV